VATTHLKAKPVNEPIRLLQSEQVAKAADKFPGMEVILTGDFNDTPESQSLANIYARFDSVYKNALGGAEPEHTTHKFRPKEGMVTRCIDYICVAKGTEPADHKIAGVAKILELPATEALPETGFPTGNHPSDHLALAAEFHFAKM
jgi:endonuclease/exonuclease/phosphatase family metal-dependent hydrolase